MEMQRLVSEWFSCWERGEVGRLPIADNFRHTSPFGTIEGKRAYIAMVEANREKFLGYRFELRDGIYGSDRACVRYRAIQGDFTLDVSEWYYAEGGALASIVSYYHIGEIRQDRKLDEPGGKE